MNRVFWAILIGFGLDLLIGDPHSIPHPVVLIGKLISVLEKELRRIFPKSVRGEQAAGAVLWGMVVTVSTVVPAGILWLCGRIHPMLALVVEAVM